MKFISALLKEDTFMNICRADGYFKCTQCSSPNTDVRRVKCPDKSMDTELSSLGNVMTIGRTMKVLCSCGHSRIITVAQVLFTNEHHPLTNIIDTKVHLK